MQIKTMRFRGLDNLYFAPQRDSRVGRASVTPEDLRNDLRWMCVMADLYLFLKCAGRTISWLEERSGKGLGLCYGMMATIAGRLENWTGQLIWWLVTVAFWGSKLKVRMRVKRGVHGEMWAKNVFGVNVLGVQRCCCEEWEM